MTLQEMVSAATAAVWLGITAEQLHNYSLGQTRALEVGETEEIEAAEAADGFDQAVFAWSGSGCGSPADTETEGGVQISWIQDPTSTEGWAVVAQPEIYRHRSCSGTIVSARLGTDGTYTVSYSSAEFSGGHTLENAISAYGEPTKLSF